MLARPNQKRESSISSEPCDSHCQLSLLSHFIIDRQRISALFLLASLLAASCSHNPIGVSDVDSLTLEQAVWKDFFAANYPGTEDGYVHLNPSTGIFGSYREWKEGLDAFLSEKFRDVSSSTIANFVSANAVQVDFPNHTKFTRGVVIDFRNEIDAMLAQGRAGGNSYFDTYPRGQGLATISRVGFNDDGTEALLYFGAHAGGLAGSGYYLLLRVQDDKWTEIERVAAWIS
ncbi:hypothetical protein OAS39_06985 [Pirellulales bacterium]|nr:hypothetical protein [Pirellulales bacterium]